jgi:TM2 domain-containing membrane protein YozV
VLSALDYLSTTLFVWLVLVWWVVWWLAAEFVVDRARSRRDWTAHSR